jgi:hypothetical protein
MLNLLSVFYALTNANLYNFTYSTHNKCIFQNILAAKQHHLACISGTCFRQGAEKKLKRRLSFASFLCTCTIPCMFCIWSVEGLYDTYRTTVSVLSSELGPPTHSPASKGVPPPGTKGVGQHSPAGEGVGRTQFGRLERKSGTLSTL